MMKKKIEEELVKEVKELKQYLEESVKLQSHYARLLNMHDGGERIQFENADEWTKRLLKMNALERSSEVFVKGQEMIDNAETVQFPKIAMKNVIKKKIEEEKGRCSCQMRKADDNNK